MNEIINIVYLAIGEKAIDQLRVSIESYRSLDDNIRVVVYSDLNFSKNTLAKLKIDELIKLELDDHGKFNNYGTPNFGKLTLHKPKILLDYAMKRPFELVIYTDIDVVALKPFRKIILDLLATGKIFVSMEGRKTMGVDFCTGFLFYQNNLEAKELLSSWINVHEQLLGGESLNYVDDQIAFNSMLLLSDYSFVQPISVSLIMPGWLYDFLYPRKSNKFWPVFFHSNWVVGDKMKLRRMKNIVLLGGIKSKYLTIKVQNMFISLTYLTLKFLRKW